jgi:hypothetical protein
VGWLLALSCVALAIVGRVAPASAQTMRPFTTFRQQHGDTRLVARLDYAAGELRLASGRSDDLYRMDLLYDENRYVPVSDFDASSGEVRLGLQPSGEGGVRVVSKHQLRQSATVNFSPTVNLDLDVTLGAAEADLELGGLQLADLTLKSGASRTAVRFSSPNGTRCRSATLTAGAAELSVIGLGNSRCDRIGFEGGVGKVLLDFRGVWTSSSSVSVRMAMGEVTLRLPRNAGVKITPDKFLSTFEPADLVRRGASYVSARYDQAARHLDINITTAVGSVRVEWEKSRTADDR